MNEPVPPRLADGIRKACAYALAITLTVLMFRVLSRLANGHLSLEDVELWVGLSLLLVGYLWVRAARRAGGRG